MHNDDEQLPQEGDPDFDHSDGDPTAEVPGPAPTPPMAYREGDAILEDFDAARDPDEQLRLTLEVAIGTRDAIENLYDVFERLVSAIERAADVLADGRE